MAEVTRRRSLPGCMGAGLYMTPRPGRLLLRPLLLDPPVHASLQQVERHRSAVEDLVVEGLDVEAGPERLLGAVAQLADLELAHLVRQRLPRPGDVAVGLRLRE